MVPFPSPPDNSGGQVLSEGGQGPAGDGAHMQPHRGSLQTPQSLHKSGIQAPGMHMAPGATLYQHQPGRLCPFPSLVRACRARGKDMDQGKGDTVPGPLCTSGLGDEGLGRKRQSRAG